jgi:hypothetical protein
MSNSRPGLSGNLQGPSVGTIVWGGILAVLAGLLTASRLGWLAMEPSVAAVTLLVAAGLALLVGGVLASMRGRGTEAPGARTTASPYYEQNNPHETGPDPK